MTKPYDEYMQLLQQKQTLSKQLDELFNGASPETIEQRLLEAITQQRIYYFKNKREIIFDSHVGLLLTNFEYMPLIEFKNWGGQQKNYAPNDIAKGKWKCLHDFYFYKKNKYFGYLSEEWYNTKIFYKQMYVKQQVSNNNFLIFYFDKDKDTFVCSEIKQNKSFLLTDGCGISSRTAQNCYILPVYHILQNDLIFPNNPRSTILEKAKIILDFFREQELIPIFQVDLKRNKGENNEDWLQRRKEYNDLSWQYFQCHQLQKQIITLEQQLAELPPPAQTWLNSEFDYRPVLAQYPLSEIQSSIWQYSLSAQTWLNTLLTQLDEWQTEHHQVMATALELNTQFEHSLPLSPRLNEQEILALNTLHQQLKQRLNFSLEPTKAKLIQLLKQNQEIERTLKQTDDLMALAELEQKKRPSFTLLAEHSATLCTENLKNLEWLEQHLVFITQLVQSAQQQHDDYLILVDKYQQDLTATASDNAVDVEHIEKWLNEWRSERLILVQQWLPLVMAGLNHDLNAETVLATLTCLAHYQTNLDQFYLKERLGIYTKFAFQANGHRQEQLEKDSQLVKLNHDFMNELQTVMFNTSTSREKLWLLQYSEVWQQQLAKEIQTFLQQENLIERDDIAQLIMDDMRKIQQQNLASCLQDAQRYSEALEQRNKDTNTFIFKMRKALTKE